MSQSNSITVKNSYSFPMLDMQQAYWIGRQDDIANDANAMHVYYELEVKDFDSERFKQAWHTLILRHEMMRAVALPDGQQMVLNDIPTYEIPNEDISALDDSSKQQKLQEVRERLAYFKADIAQWPQFKIYILQDKDKATLCFNLDTWCVDGRSLTIIFSELHQLYYNPDNALPALLYKFSDYVQAVQQYEKTQEFALALEYWKNKLKDFFPSPQLPLSKTAGAKRFKRIDSTFTVNQTQQIKNYANRIGVTINGLLLGIFAETLSYWTQSKKFTLNIPRFNRPQIHEQINDVVGEFASFSLLSIDLSQFSSVEERIIGIQYQLWEEMEYGQVSGIRILREMAKQLGKTSFSTMPIVFTSGAEQFINNQEKLFGNLVYSLSETPQVWLDSQFHVQHEKLYINWDYMEGRFPQGLIESMFSCYEGILKSLEDTSTHDRFKQRNLRCFIPNQAINHATSNLKQVDYVPLYKQLCQSISSTDPQKPAVIIGNRVINYDYLAKCIHRLSHHFLAYSHKNKGDVTIVAIFLPKSEWQIISVWASIAAGYTYLPIDIEQPSDRLKDILLDANPAIIVGNTDTLGLLPTLQTDTILVNVDEEFLHADELNQNNEETLPGLLANPHALCYVMYTSGTTGKPKGVMVTNVGVVNAVTYTSQSLIQNATPDLVTMGISALHHDMSVFDVIGTFINQGTLVLPLENDRKNPAKWVELIQQHNITLWISVPAMLEMLLIWLSFNQTLLNSLKVILTGGDWIAVSLRHRLKQYASNTKIYSVGGPTETTMWNISQEIKDESEWDTVPYGIPIDNCYYRLLNDDLEEVPTWVIGQMYCGGISLAKGYLNDPDQTTKKFIMHPIWGERLYATGDLGRYHADGRIEFIGRMDTQLKINGIRVEEAEIKAKLETIPEILKAVIYLYDNQLAATILLPRNQEILSEQYLYEQAKKLLSATTVPTIWHQVYELPLTKNGKADLATIVENTKKYITERYNHSQKVLVPKTLNETEAKLSAIWNDILKEKPLSREDNFFALGGDSLLVIKLLSKIQEKFHVDVSLPELFQKNTLGEQAVLIDALTIKEGTIGENLSIKALHLDKYPVSLFQEDMIIAELLSSNKVQFKIILSFEIDEEVNTDYLLAALNQMRNTHDVLGYVFSVDSSGIYQHIDKSRNIPLVIEPTVTSTDTLSIINQLIQLPIDIFSGYAWRVHYIPIKERQSVLLFNFHHVIFDGWSIPLFFEELSKYYTHAKTQITTPVKQISSTQISYGDYAVWHRHFIDRTEANIASFWESELKTIKPLIHDVLVDKPIAKHYSFVWDKTKTNVIKDFSKKHEVSLYITLLSIMQIILFAIFRQHNFLIGTSSFGREETVTHKIIGCFNNTPVFPVRINSSDSIESLIRAVQERYTNILNMPQLPFSKLAQYTNLSGTSQGLNPLCQLCFVMQGNEEDNQFTLGDLSLEKIEVNSDDIRLIYEISFWITKDGETKFSVKFDQSRTTLINARKITDTFSALVLPLLENSTNSIDEVLNLTLA